MEARPMTVALAMILYPPPGSPFVLQAGATLLLAAHIGGGSIGVLSGFAALFAPKGGRIHRLAGKVFLVSMLTMAGVAACVAPFMASQQWSNTIGGVVTGYFVLTGWAAARRPSGRLGWPEAAAVVAPLGVLGVIGLGFALGTNGKDGAPAPAPYVMGGLTLLAAQSDLRVIWRRGLVGGQRLARHLWRLCAALLIATGSALAQPRIVPPALQTSPLLLLPILAILGMMTYWLARLARSGRRRVQPAAQPAGTLAAT
jgi:hypothetical protein